jgi:hypothetical protein
MKSLVEEASSITKAIEKAWTRAGKPQSFSVKIFENPESGFLGLTTKKSAKVGIFFEEAVEKPGQRPYTRSSNSNNRRPERPRSNDRPPRSTDSERGTGRRSESRGQGARPQRSDSRPPRSTDNDRSRTRDDRPPRRRENDRPATRPQRSENPLPRRTDSRPEQKPAAKPVAPKVTTPSPAAAPAPVVKKTLKISGRRFSGHKKTEDK